MTATLRHPLTHGIIAALAAGALAGCTAQQAGNAQATNPSDVAMSPALIAEGKLVRLLPDWSTKLTDFFLYYSSRRHVPVKLRVFADFLKREAKRSAETQSNLIVSETSRPAPRKVRAFADSGVLALWTSLQTKRRDRMNRRALPTLRLDGKLPTHGLQPLLHAG